MMYEEREYEQLPVCCINCTDPDCGSCDYAAERWVKSQAQELRLKRILKIKAISRLQREISEIDCLLSKYEVVE